MRALVAYESMYGNTHLIADAIGRELAESGAEVAGVPVDQATSDRIAAADLVVVGGPTHAHGMSREATRQAAVTKAAEPGSGLGLDPDGDGEGLRNWFDALPVKNIAAAAFDTRFHMLAAVAGPAAAGMSGPIAGGR